MTQDQVAERLGITKGAVSQWESGKTEPRSDLLRKFAEITNKPLDWLMGFNSASGFGDSASRVYSKLMTGSENNIAVYDYKITGDDGAIDLSAEPPFTIACPPQLIDVKGVYAIVISSDKMAPRYEEGEIIFIDPTRHARPDDYVVARLRTDKPGVVQAVIGKLVRHDSQQLVIRRLNPDMMLYYPTEQILALELIVISSVIR